MRKYIVKTEIGQVADPYSGEVTSYVEKKEIVRKDSEPFFLTYSKQILALYDLPFFNVTTKVFWKLLEFAEFNTGIVYMTPERKEEIQSICNISKASYYRALDELKKADIISGTGTRIVINENMFWKGDLKARDAIVQAKLKMAFSPVFSEEVTEKEKEEVTSMEYQQ